VTKNGKEREVPWRKKRGRPALRLEKKGKKSSCPTQKRESRTFTPGRKTLMRLEKKKKYSAYQRAPPRRQSERRPCPRAQKVKKARKKGGLGERERSNCAERKKRISEGLRRMRKGKENRRVGQSSDSYKSKKSGTVPRRKGAAFLKEKSQTSSAQPEKGGLELGMKEHSGVEKDAAPALGRSGKKEDPRLFS